MKKKFKIAIDGPVGVGKGTLAVALSKKLGALYINTGAMYRSLAFACLKEKIDINSGEDIFRVLKNTSIDLQIDNEGMQKVFLNGKEISREIFLPEVNNSVAIVSEFPDVRKEMVRRQKELIENKERVVIEGRDIATEVSPDADIKIFLTADIETRAKRRFEQMIEKGIDTDLETVLSETKKRDKTDTERKASPLIITSDAYVLDTTNLSIDETVSKVIEKMKEKGII